MQSAARSKERKLRYIAELEAKVAGLQMEATEIDKEIALLQQDMGLLGENAHPSM